MAQEEPAGGQGGGPGGGEWLTVAAAARRLGISPRSVRGRIARGTLQWKPAGNSGKLVLVEPGGTPAGGPEGDLEDELDLLRGELMDARERAARAEERAAALREALERERGQHDELVAELKAQLVEARRPWWRRLLG
jgi:hypothetical protein